MHVMLKFPVGSKLHAPHDADHRGRVCAEALSQSTHTEQNELPWSLECGTDDGLPFRAQQGESRRRAQNRDWSRGFPPFFHRAQKHVGKTGSCQPRRGRGRLSRFCFGVGIMLAQNTFFVDGQNASAKGI